MVNVKNVAITLCIIAGLYLTSCSSNIVPMGLRTNQVTILYITWTPGPAPLSFEGLANEITSEERDQLQTLKLTGRMSVGRVSGMGDTQATRMLVIMYHQLDEPTTLYMPTTTNIMYVQSESGWKMYPANAPTDSREAIHLDVSEPQSLSTLACYVAPGVGQSCYSAFSWYYLLSDEELLATVKDPQSPNRGPAALELGHRPQVAEKVVPLLAQIFLSGVLEAGDTLYELGPAAKAAIPSLLMALDSDNREIRLEAVLVLEKSVKLLIVLCHNWLNGCGISIRGCAVIP